MIHCITVFFLVYPYMVGGMIAQVVPCRDKMTGSSECLLPVEIIRPARDEHILEGDTRVPPFGYNSRLEDDGNAGFRREVVAQRASNVFYRIFSFEQLC